MVARPATAAARRLGLAAALVSGLFGASASAAAALRRPSLVSINLCADQLVLALADPGQILGLSPYARNPARSWDAEAATHFRALSGGAEEVLVLKPDLVFAGSYLKRTTRELLRAQGFRVVELDEVRTLDEAKRQIDEVGALVGHPERAAAASAAIDAAAARAKAAASGHPQTVLPLERRGWISGGESLITSLLAAAGLRNAGAELSGGFGRQVTLESIVASRPDLLLVSNAGDAAEDEGAAFLQHPALTELYPPSRRLVLPETLTVCGGPTVAVALDRLSAEIRQHR